MYRPHKLGQSNAFQGFFFFIERIIIRSEKTHKKVNAIDFTSDILIIVLGVGKDCCRSTVSWYVEEFEAATRATAYILNAKAKYIKESVYGMKRIIALLLAAMLCVTLCACGKSQSVKDVENVIKNIGTVTLDSGEAIEKAERMYEYLTEKEREQVENKGKLVEARYTYDKIYTDKVYATAKEAYELLKEAARLYYFNSTNLYKAGNFGNNANMMVTDSEFCKKFAEATGDYQNYPKYTEDEVREALAITKKMYEDDGWEWSGKATMKVCMNLHFQAFYEVRDYKPSSAVEEAGVLLLELKDTYHDEKYYPVLLEYRDFVASGDGLTLNISSLKDIPVKQREYQNEYTQCEMKIDPMFVN